MHASVRRNLAGNAADDAARLYWLPLVLGETLVVDVELPAGASPNQEVLQQVRLSPFFRLPFLENGGCADTATDAAPAGSADH